MAKKQPLKLEDVRKLLQDSGLRATPCRIAVYQDVWRHSNPVSHQEVADNVEALAFDKSTVFRALNDLAEAGLMRRMELGDHVWRYEIVSASKDADDQGHPHLLCVDCGAITCLTHNEVQVAVSKSFGVVEEILLKGHCEKCRD